MRSRSRKGEPDYLQRLQRYVRKGPKLVVGVHSGTSADGPTVVIARISGFGDSARAAVLSHHTYEYPRRLRQLVLECTDRTTGTVERIVQADMAVGEFIGDSVVAAVEAAALSLADIELVGSSGQITYQVIPGERSEHLTCLGREYMGMLDLGEGSVIALKTGVVTVTTLRRKDNHVGGFGAPMVPFGDWVNFRSDDEARVIWNIGGITNATVLRAGAPFQDVTAFDAGPGNMLIDQLVSRASDGELTFDRDGELARSGRSHPGLVADHMGGRFIQQRPPKAAARQTFGVEAASRFWEAGIGLGLRPADIVASATRLTVESLAFAQETFIDPQVPNAELVFAGGGVFNLTLMEWLRERMPARTLRTSDEFAVPVEAREALAMVLVANETVHGRPSNCVPATGASRHVVQGKIDIPG